LASGGSVLELAVTGFYQTWGKLLAASYRSDSYSPPSTKTLPCKPITEGNTRKTEKKSQKTSKHLWGRRNILIKIKNHLFYETVAFVQKYENKYLMDDM